MKKEEVIVLAQLLTAIKDGIEKLEEAQKKQDAEQLESAKQEILHFQKKVAELL